MFNVVSIGFNQPPIRRRPSSFATQYGINQPNWDFLSPPAAMVPAGRGLWFCVRRLPGRFDHVLQVSIVDAQGASCARCTANPWFLRTGRTPQDADGGRHTGSVQRTAGDLMDRVRIVCTVYDPKTGAYRVDYTLPIQIAGG